MNTDLNDKLKGITGKVTLILRNVETGKEEVTEINNVACTVGKNSIALRLAGLDAPANMIGVATYMAVGTGAGVPAAGDTAMSTELARKLISSPSVSGNVATFTTFYNTSEANGVLTEVGLFGDLASATPGSGTLYAHAAISKTKTSSDTLTVVWAVTIS